MAKKRAALYAEVREDLKAAFFTYKAWRRMSLEDRVERRCREEDVFYVSRRLGGAIRLEMTEKGDEARVNRIRSQIRKWVWLRKLFGARS